LQDESLIETDIVVVGGTAAGCSAAISAARQGARVVVLEPSSSLGGTTTNGVHCFDTGSLPSLSGITEEFIGRVRKYYADAGLDHPMLKSGSDVFWEFHVAERIWREIIAEHPAITFLNGAVAVGVKMRGPTTIAEVLWERAIDPIGSLPDEPASVPNVVRAKQFIDASYEGDIAAWAGAPCDIGREARSDEEPHAGVIYTTTHERAINPGGYLPSTILPGSTGEGDDAIMSFTCRMSLRYRTTGYEDHLLKAPPEGYDASLYTWAPKNLPQGGGAFGTELQPSMFGKMLTNQRYFGDDRLKGNRDYILSHPRQRSQIRKDFINHSLGFLYYIQTEGGMPQLGLSEDEFTDNGNMPRSPYVREGRRFRGRIRLKENDVSAWLSGTGPRPPLRKDSIAIGDWTVESRRCKDAPNPLTNTFDGSMFIRTLRAPYQIPFGCLVPDGLDNLLVTTTVSASHVAFCAMRVEALWSQTGAATGIAAHLAIADGGKVGDVPVAEIQAAMLKQRFKLTYFSDVGTDHPEFEAIQWLALRGFLPAQDRAYAYYPSNSASWADLMEATVKAFDLPLSITGIHFDTIEPDDPVFRYAETLYDTASRSGVALFPNMFKPLIDAPADHLLPEARQRWLTVLTRAAVTGEEAVAFLACLGQIVGPAKDGGRVRAYDDKAPLTRAGLAGLLHAFAAG
jgi:hypothetical protein